MNDKIDFSQLCFIIGAGAHVPYGMPTSALLTEKIKELNHPKIIISNIQPSPNVSDLENEKRLICRTMAQLGLVEQSTAPSSSNDYDIKLGKALDNFLDTFAKSQVYSIDAFLAKYINEHAENQDDKITLIGKLVLVYFIAKFENQTPAGYHKFDWIQFIINEYLRDKDTCENFFKNPPPIFTFNYDRLLEQSLMNHLIHFHFIDRNKAVEMIKNLKITHIYGDLGSFEENFNFANVGHVSEAINRIRVIGEERFKNFDEISTQIFTSTKDLKAIYLLGYGFDTNNNSLLFSKFNEFTEKRNQTRLPNRKPHPPISFPHLLATNIKLSKEDKRRVANEIGSLRINFGAREELYDKVDSLYLLRTLAPFQQIFKEPKKAVTPKPRHENSYLDRSWMKDY